jgi:aldose 1-epimerase
MSVTVSEFGHLPSGETVLRYTITNKHGASASLLNYGATWQSMFVPNRKGELVDVILGYDTVEDYQKNLCSWALHRPRGKPHQGRAFFAERREYKLAANMGNHCLHGGVVGFDKKIWQAQIDGTPSSFR